MFNAVIAASPDLTWDRDFPLRQTSEFLKDQKVFPHALYLSMGNEETGDPKPTRFERLCASLTTVKAEGFRWGSESMPDEDHGSVVLRTHYGGLRKVFEGWRVPVDPATGRFKGALPELQQHYAKLSQRLGIRIAPPEASLNQVGYQILGQGWREEAIAVFRHGVELYPGSANAHDSLGEALEQAGRLEESRANYQKAVDLGQKAQDPQLEIYARNRDRVAKAIGGH